MRLWPTLSYYLYICLQKVRKTAKTLGQDSWYFDRVSNRGPSESKTGAPPFQLPDC
jgi:hypothetical protein